ncbi:hypothetical protein BJX99DRAFT_259366 [Aspergillus californicus]
MFTSKRLVLTRFSSPEPQLQMTLYKISARRILSCCDRSQQQNPRYIKKQPRPRYNNDDDDAVPPALPQHTFNRLNSSSWPTPHKSRWLSGRKPVIALEHRDRNIRTTCADGLPETPPEPIIEKPFTYDTVVFGQQPETVVYRRLRLDFQGSNDAISDEITHLLNLPIAEYTGSEIILPNGSFVMPIGTVQVKWKLYDGKKPYTTKFLVIKDSQSDMLLGRSSIQEYNMWERDGDIIHRLQNDTGC